MDELYAFSLSLSNCISDGNSAGATNYAVMAQDTPLPVIQLSQKSPGIDTRGGNIMNDANTEIYTPIQKVLYKGTLGNFLGVDIPNYNELPFDYGVVFTGLIYRFSDIVSSRERKGLEKKGMESCMIDIIHSLDISEEDRRTFIHTIQNPKDEYLNQEIDAQNLRILNGFRDLLQNRSSGNVVEDFIQIIQQVGLLSFSYHKENRFLSAFQYLFHKYSQFRDEDIGILPFNRGKIGGSLLFVIKKGRSHHTIEKVFKKLSEEGYIASLDYASWKDGYASNGVQLEQFISEKIYSPYTKQGDLLYTDTLGKTYSSEYDTIIGNENRGILLDTISGRIYIKGVRLTSKEIHSQNTTIDMLKILIENIGKEVSNGKLPVSTYSQNKNEILGKIVLPIKKIALESFGVELSLTCSGGITDYYLKLEQNEDIAIGIIQRLYE